MPDQIPAGLITAAHLGLTLTVGTDYGPATITLREVMHRLSAFKGQSVTILTREQPTASGRDRYLQLHPSALVTVHEPIFDPKRDLAILDTIAWIRERTASGPFGWYIDEILTEAQQALSPTVPPIPHPTSEEPNS